MRCLIHFFDANEHLRRSELIECRSDGEAITAARRRVHSHVLEVWSGDRQVWRYDPAQVIALAS